MSLAFDLSFDECLPIQLFRPKSNYWVVLKVSEPSSFYQWHTHAASGATTASTVPTGTGVTGGSVTSTSSTVITSKKVFLRAYEQTMPVYSILSATPYVCNGLNVLASNVDYQQGVEVLINDQVVTSQVKENGPGKFEKSHLL